MAIARGYGRLRDALGVLCEVVREARGGEGRRCQEEEGEGEGAAWYELRGGDGGGGDSGNGNGNDGGDGSGTSDANGNGNKTSPSSSSTPHSVVPGLTTHLVLTDLLLDGDERKQLHGANGAANGFAK